MTDEPAHVGLSLIRTDGGTQARDGLNEAKVIEYMERMIAGDQFPPVDLVYDGRDYWLWDGFHRVEARRRLQKEGQLHGIVDAVVISGTQRDARRKAAGANASHGIPRTNEDKRRAVLIYLEDDEWRAYSDRKIADELKVSPTFVGKIRATLTVHVDSDETQERKYITKHGTEAVMNTANIGRAGDPGPLKRAIEANINPAAYEDIRSLQNAVLAYYSPYSKPDTIVLLESLKADHKNSAWPGLTTHLVRQGKVFRVNDLRQAVNNALDGLRQRLAELQPILSQSAEPAQETPDELALRSAEEIVDLMAHEAPAVYRIPAEMMQRFGDLVSASALTNNRASGIVEYSGGNWVITGGLSRGNKWEYIEAIQATEPKSFNGTVVNYDIIGKRDIRGEWFYHGQLIKHKGVEYVLVGPEVSFEIDEQSAPVPNNEQTPDESVVELVDKPLVPFGLFTEAWENLNSFMQQLPHADRESVTKCLGFLTSLREFESGLRRRYLPGVPLNASSTAVAGDLLNGVYSLKVNIESIPVSVRHQLAQEFRWWSDDDKKQAVTQPQPRQDIFRERSVLLQTIAQLLLAGLGES